MNIVSDEKDLLSQIDEFRQRAEHLQTALNAREEKAEQLELVVAERQEKAYELEQLIEEREKQADVIKRTIHSEMITVSDQLTTELSQLQGKLNDIVQQASDRHFNQFKDMTQSLDDFSTRLDELQATTETIPDAIHKEGVQVYRNTQETIKSLEERVKEIDKVDRHVGRAKAPAVVAAVFAILTFGGVVFSTLLTLGVIHF